jgi:hypothetical protein
MQYLISIEDSEGGSITVTGTVIGKTENTSAAKLASYLVEVINSYMTDDKTDKTVN